MFNVTYKEPLSFQERCDALPHKHTFYIFVDQSKTHREGQKEDAGHTRGTKNELQHEEGEKRTRSAAIAMYRQMHRRHLYNALNIETLYTEPTMYSKQVLVANSSSRKSTFSLRSLLLHKGTK